MDILFLDIETTALKPEEGDIIQLAAYDATLGMTFHAFVRPRLVKGTWGAFMLHESTGLIKEVERCSTDKSAVRHAFLAFLGEQRYTLVGKNVHFDVRWLDFHDYLPANKQAHFSSCYADVGLLCWDPKVDGGRIPSLVDCYARMGLPPTDAVAHDARGDVQYIVDIFNAYYKLPPQVLEFAPFGVRNMAQ